LREKGWGFGAGEGANVRSRVGVGLVSGGVAREQRCCLVSNAKVKSGELRRVLVSARQVSKAAAASKQKNSLAAVGQLQNN